MKRTMIKCAALGVLSVGLPSAVNADIIAGRPVTSPVGLSTASIEFRSAGESRTGEFYFLGWGTEEDVLHQAPDSNRSHLGQLLFNTHESEPGSQVGLPGEFDTGSVLHFAYKIVSPRDQRDLFRTDEQDDRFNFAYDPANGDYRVAGLRGRDGRHDGDDDDEDDDERHFRGDDDGGDCLGGRIEYTDAMFTISFQSIPAPGSVVLLSLGGLAMTRRRRRC